MTPDPSHPMPPGAHTLTQVPRDDLQAEYGLLRNELERLLAEPVKNLARVDALVDQLERVQLAFKQQHGVKGNNPNE